MPADYSYQNLRGRSFKGQNLAGANFSGADIRSADFTGANLEGASFKHAKAGLQKRWATLLVIVSLALAGILGFLSGFAGAFVGGLIFDTKLSNEIGYPISGYTVIGTLFIFFFVTIRLGIQRALGFLTLAVALALALAGGFAVVFPGTVGFVGIGVLAFAIAAVVAISFTTVVAFNLVVAGNFAVVAAFAFALAGAFASATVIFVITFAVILVLLSTYIGYFALKEDSKQVLIYSITIAVAAFQGTNFRNANLTDVDFGEATLKNTDFRKATLTRTCFHKTKKLDLARPGQSYLQNAQVRLLLVSGFGQNKAFDRQDMRGVNLQGVNLENTNFIDADLYQANLQNANLSRAILVRTNLERTDLRGACLTGSCIQDWTISNGTKLDGIICDYVYLKWDDVKKDKRDQMPPRGKFKEGGFVTFIKYILDTVELYHEKDINPRLALSVLQKMSRDYDEPLDIIALGKRGERVFIQVKVSESIIQDQFKEDYYSRYDENLKLWSGNTHLLPPVVNSFIEKRINEIASERTDDFVFIDVAYVEGNYTEINQGDTTMTSDRNIHMGSGNYNERIQGDYVQGNYYAAGQPQSLAQAAAEIQELLKQLEQTYPTATISQQMVVAAEAINRIESNPTMKQKVINAVKEGGLAAFEKAIDNPAGAFVVGAIKGWQEIEAKD